MTSGVLRHGGMGKVFAGVKAPSTDGTFLRSFTLGQVHQREDLTRTQPELEHQTGHCQIPAGAQPAQGAGKLTGVGCAPQLRTRRGPPLGLSEQPRPFTGGGRD